MALKDGKNDMNYHMIIANILSKHDNMHNNDVNYVLKSLKNNELSI